MMSIGPILSAFSGYLQGLDTIRAFGRMDAFQHQFDKAISGFMDVSHVQVCTDCMSQFFVGGPACCGLFMLPLALLLIYTREQPGVAGLLLMYGASCSMRLPGALFSTVEVEKRMVSAQRVVEYIEMEVESALKSPPHKTSHEMDNWSPCEGALELHDVQMRYAPDLPLVLDGVSLKIEAGTKVGVVGRTGAGKSSLVLAVFRMMELDTGKITIDEVDVTTMPARTLRGALGMIPQDTFVWSGTVRENLDVTGQKTDAEIWAALEQVSLKQNVEELDGQLEHEIHEKGSNLSAGTVQLICLARVLLKQPKVIFMDEATASVDLATDTAVQETIRRAFAKSTIVTIAHRLNTVIDFDKIVVMDAGKVAEHGSAHELLQIPDGLFLKLVDSTGASSATELRKRAAAAADARRLQ